MTSLRPEYITTELTPYEKQVIIVILIAIMEADYMIDPREIDYLDNVISSYDISESELDAIGELDFNQIVSDFKTFEDSKKKEAISLFTEMAKCDGYVDPRELKIISLLGQ